MNLKILLNCCLIEINKINKSRHSKYNERIKYTDEYYLTILEYVSVYTFYFSIFLLLTCVYLYMTLIIINVYFLY